MRIRISNNQSDVSFILNADVPREFRNKFIGVLGMEEFTYKKSVQVEISCSKEKAQIFVKDSGAIVSNQEVVKVEELSDIHRLVGEVFQERVEDQISFLLTKEQSKALHSLLKIFKN